MWSVVVVLGFVLIVVIGASAVPVGAQGNQQSEQESNNERSEATAVTLRSGSADVAGVLGFLDEDWYAFDVEQGSTITIDYIGSAGEARLRGPDGTVLDSDSPTIRRLQSTAPETEI